MKRKWTLLFYVLQLVWCIWLVILAWDWNANDPNGLNLSALILSLGLLVFWVWSIYRTAKPKKPIEPTVVELSDESITKAIFDDHIQNDTKVIDIWETLSEKQKNVVYFMIGKALEGASSHDKCIRL